MSDETFPYHGRAYGISQRGLFVDACGWGGRSDTRSVSWVSSGYSEVIVAIRRHCWCMVVRALFHVTWLRHRTRTVDTRIISKINASEYFEDEGQLYCVLITKAPPCDNLLKRLLTVMTRAAIHPSYQTSSFPLFIFIGHYLISSACQSIDRNKKRSTPKRKSTRTM